MYSERFVESAMATKEFVEREMKYRLHKLICRICRLHNKPQYWLTKRNSDKLLNPERALPPPTSELFHITQLQPIIIVLLQVLIADLQQ